MKTVEILPLFDKTHLSLFLTIFISMSFCPGDLAQESGGNGESYERKEESSAAAAAAEKLQTWFCGGHERDNRELRYCT